MSEKMHVDDFKDAVQVLDAGAASPTTLPKGLQRRMAADWRRARASEAEQAKQLQEQAQEIARLKARVADLEEALKWREQQWAEAARERDALAALRLAGR